MVANVAHYPVSTDRRGVRGVGLDAQRQAVRNHLGAHQLVADFAEIESGRRHTNRPQHVAALEDAASTVSCW